jgi:glycosyltransferase involved in cell wall biosynthesis
MSKTKLTVGIPTFNRASWLPGAIESVLAQNFTSFRLIVSDNASDDDTAEVVRSFSDERITYIRSERNIGSIGNLNRLIGLADTEYLVLLPDDDVLYPGHLQAVVDVLERFATVGLAHTAFDLIDPEARILQSVNPVPSRAPVKIERRDRALERMMVSSWGLCFPSVAYRTKAIAAAGGFREEEGAFGDIQLWMRVALDWDFGYVAKRLAGFRIHPNRVTTDLATKHRVESEGRERFLLFSKMIFDRRTDFLNDAPLPSSRMRWLRTLANLHFLIDSAAIGLPWTDVAARIANLARTDPRIVSRRAFWRLLIAQLGGRRVRSALRRMRPGAAALTAE